MRGLLLLALLPLAGCLEKDGVGDCDPASMRGVVEAIEGRQARVHLEDGQPAVLHLPDAVFVETAGECAGGSPSSVRTGDALAFDVDVWAESYPMQGWPERVVVLR